MLEKEVVNGLELYHTFRGHQHEVEVYTFQDGPKTYNLFKKKGDSQWRCDWVTAHSWGEITLDAPPTDLQAMLHAFAEMLKSQT
ncbi:MAG: hypothetical protein ACE5H9_14325 [Anaerolineae bacterium]